MRASGPRTLTSTRCWASCGGWSSSEAGEGERRVVDGGAYLEPAAGRGEAVREAGLGEIGGQRAHFDPMLGGHALRHLFQRLGTASDGQDVQAAPGEGLDPGGTKALRGPSDDSPRPLWQVSTQRGHMATPYPERPALRRASRGRSNTVHQTDPSERVDRVLPVAPIDGSHGSQRPPVVRLE